MPYDTMYYPGDLAGHLRREYWTGGSFPDYQMVNWKRYIYRDRSGTNTVSSSAPKTRLPFVKRRELKLVTSTRSVKRRYQTEIFVHPTYQTRPNKPPERKEYVNKSGKVVKPGVKVKTFRPQTRLDKGRLVSKIVWKTAWEYVRTYRYIAVRYPHNSSAAKKKRPVKYISPNALSFYLVKMVEVEDTSLKATNPAISGWTREVTGNTDSLGIAIPGSWGTSPPSPMHAMFSTPASSQYASELTKLETAALGKLRDKVKNQKINLANVAVEAQRTADTIGKLGIRLAKVMLALKSAKLKQAARLIFPKTEKEMGNEWLLWQYGVLPLIKDIQGAVDELGSYKKNPKYKKYVGTATYDINETGNFSATGIAATGTYTSKGKLVVKYRAEVAITDALLEDLNRLGITNLTTGAWEAIPFSFVIDWFLPIGNWLNRLDALQGWAVINCTRTTFSKVTHTCTTHIGGSTSDGWTWDNATCSWKKEIVECTRVLLPSIPVMPFPSFKNPISAIHALNAMALLTQLRK